MMQRMMFTRLIIVILITMLTQWVVAQGNSVGISDLQWSGAALKTTDPKTLAEQLTAPYASDKQKVTAIFRWITDNIEYQVRDRFARPYPRYRKDNFKEEEDTSMVLKPLNERVAEGVLKKRTAVCDGYARLFKTLCDYAGIKAEIINGYVRTSLDKMGNKFRSNHSWNAVFLDSAWHLLDPTWASGFTNLRGDEFIKHYDNFYFLTPPDQLIRTHYPEEIHWTLLSDHTPPREFNQTPFKHQAYIKHKILSFKPAKGVIDAQVGDTLHFELEVEDVEKELRIVAGPYFDSSEREESLYDLRPAGVKLYSRVHKSFVLDSDHHKWIYVLYDGEVIMRYKLNAKPGEVKTAIPNSAERNSGNGFLSLQLLLQLELFDPGMLH